MKNLKIIKLGIFALLMFTLSACNKQKAEALKIAAEQFRKEAIESIDQLNFIYSQNIPIITSTEEEEIEIILNDLNTLESNMIEISLLDEWTTIGESTNAITNSELDLLKVQYYQFESMFTSLDKGSYFAKDIVKKTEKYAINLTVQLINFSKTLQTQELQFSSRRIRILEKMKSAKELINAQLRNEHLKNAARDYIQLKKEEKLAKENAIIQCLKAAQSGKLVAELIRDYDKMKAVDILNSVKNSMNYVNAITNNNENVTQLLSKFEEIESTIQNDPYWSVLLNQTVVNN